MKYDPQDKNCPLPFTPFRSCVVPRPIAWISSIDEKGNENLAPFSQCGIITFDPPMVMFSANHYPTGQRKDSAVNAEKTGWFVWNMATEALKEAVNISAMIVPSDQSEFELAGLEKVKADLSNVPMVKASPCHLECRYVSTTVVQGNGELGTVDVIIGEVIRVHINDNYITPDGRMDIESVRPIARMGYIDYTVINNTFSMEVPMTDDVRKIMNEIMAGSSKQPISTGKDK
ncbi:MULTISPECIES: flavin reductase family protein [Pseudomonas]|uniref:NADH-FMN oxidoreductase RutF, flavin reductase (DIM6/NTAB) family n=6 Tax=Pseudomonas TaxID=286 RepID=A0AB37ZV21_PSESX|nr:MULTISPECIES: flavin reductase family protein [Pseudomonas]MCW6054623.1 flavin reductase family protein [Pseudomonas fragi]AZG85691.1 flavin reductase family protein [Pseudomonas syringae pv. pisi str. PP1]MBI6669845.1 flavin reductase family protein [Pseudomonas syringae]MBI6673730.1 flavin reductase family protein [Pseudomonas syringae]MBI6679831.1 flavin reductase family protein [Pseudomonas syringae]